MVSRWISSSARRAAVLTAAVLCATGAAGCYTFEPTMSTMLAPGKSVALDLNDLGRLNLGPQIGQEVRRVQGILVSQSSTGYVVRVNQVDFFNGRSAQWSGEAVNVRNDYVGIVYEEKLSPSRTALAVASGVAGVGAIVAAKAL